MLDQRGADGLDVVRSLEQAARRIDTSWGDGRIAWRCWGDGPPLLLLHGGYGSWKHWVRNIDDLSRRFRVIAVDLPGLGDSDEAPQPHTAEALASLMHAGLRQVVPDGRLSIASFSLGSVIGACLAAELGGRLDHLIMFGPSGVKPHWQDATKELSRWERDSTLAERRAVVRANLAVTMIADPAKIDDLAVGVQLDLLSQKRRLRGMPISQSDALLTALPRVAGKITIVWGEHDPYIRPDVRGCIKLLEQEFPAIGFHVFDGVGHWVIFEAAAQANTLVADRLGTPR